MLSELTPTRHFMCTACLGESWSQLWMGRCGDCGSINTLREGPEVPPVAATPTQHRAMPKGRPFTKRAPGTPPAPFVVLKRARSVDAGLPDDATPQDMAELPQEQIPRNATGHPSWDIHMDGFPIVGCVMFTGEPGAGKSRLSLELLARMANKGFRCTVISGEEQDAQLGARIAELRLTERFPWPRFGLVSYTTNDFERALAHIQGQPWDLVLLDAVNVLYDRALGGPKASVRQLVHMITTLHHCAWAATGTRFDGQRQRFIMPIAHLTKDGEMAGPKAAEHLGDGVLQIDHVDVHGDPIENRKEATGHMRLCCPGKNRFGSAYEKSYLWMTPKPEGILLPYTPVPKPEDD